MLAVGSGADRVAGVEQLRIYDVDPADMDRVVSGWRDQVVPLRRQFGFHVVGAWVEADASRFVWIVGHDGDFEAAGKAYYESPERNALDPNPAELIKNVDARMLRAV
jgi:hypothetical protein